MPGPWQPAFITSWATQPGLGLFRTLQLRKKNALGVAFSAIELLLLALLSKKLGNGEISPWTSLGKPSIFVLHLHESRDAASQPHSNQIPNASIRFCA